MNIPDWTKVKKQEKTIKIHYPDFYNYINITYPADLPFIEKLYWYINNINDYPKCVVCGKKVTFKDSKHGYHRVCSLKCRNADPKTIEKKRLTLINNYGSVEASYQDRIEKAKQTLIDRYGSVEASYQDRMEKTKQTNLERYGVEYNMSTNEFKEKAKQTNLERYGVENVACSKVIQNRIKQTLIDRYGSVEASYQDRMEKTKQTNLERYGVEYAQQNKKILNKSKKTIQTRIINKYDHILDIKIIDDEFFYVIKCPHNNCTKCKEKSFLISSNLYWTRYNKPTEICTILAPYKKIHNSGTNLELVIRSILDKYNIEYITNDRNIISPQELDIYIPSKHIAIECNGIRWHSTNSGKSYKYHQDKYFKCLENGVQLLTFWEDQIIYKYDIVESIICSKLGIINNSIYARNCTVKEIDKKLCKSFLNENHIQGEDKSKIKLGLFYNNELVAVMTFNKGNKCSGTKSKDINEWDLNRFCTKLNYRIVGGCSKLLSYFIKKENPHTIVSYACLDISNGNLYKQLGFSEKNTSLGYWYFNSKDYKRYHRSSFTKSKLIKDGYDPNMTEDEIMRMRNFYKIYDCGRKKYVLKLNN